MIIKGGMSEWRRFCLLLEYFVTIKTISVNDNNMEKYIKYENVLKKNTNLRIQKERCKKKKAKNKINSPKKTLQGSIQSLHTKNVNSGYFWIAGFEWYLFPNLSTNAPFVYIFH